MTPLEFAKQRIRIPELAARRGWDWKPGKTCCIPYRPDAHPSGSVFASGTLFHDYTTGENLDAPALLARVERVSNNAACKILIQLTESENRNGRARRFESPKPPPLRHRIRFQPRLPKMLVPSLVESERIAKLRNVCLEAVELAVSRGFLFTSYLDKLPCWALTDRASWACQLRRIDGDFFTSPGGANFKAWTVQGSYGSWPIGCNESRRFDRVAFVEGGGDFLAALHFAIAEQCADRVAPVAMLGASQHIAYEALPLFRGKRIRIFAHVDQPNVVNGKRAGLEGVARWQEQLLKARAEVDCVDLSGLRKCDDSPVTDLNDVTSIDADDFERERVLHALMDF